MRREPQCHPTGQTGSTRTIQMLKAGKKGSREENQSVARAQGKQEWVVTAQEGAPDEEEYPSVVVCIRNVAPVQRDGVKGRTWPLSMLRVGWESEPGEQAGVGKTSQARAVGGSCRADGEAVAWENSLL